LSCSPFTFQHIILKETVNLVIKNIYYQEEQTIWTPHQNITASSTNLINNYGAEIEWFANGVVHLIMREIITHYNKIKDDPQLVKFGKRECERKPVD
jgi:hypothetical protein